MKRSVLPYLICEVANVHGGNIDYIKKLIMEFKRVDYNTKAIKFQAFQPDKIALKDFEWYSVYEELFIDRTQWHELIQEASKYGDVWLDIFDTFGTEILKENSNLINGIKLQASILQNLEVFTELTKLDLSSKYFIINISGFDLNAIHKFIEKYREISNKLILQIGFQGYPTKIEDTGLHKISILKASFPDLELCIADHSDATTDFALRAPIYGYLLGCNYIEKHICLARDISRFDKYSALEPEQVDTLCREIKNAYHATTGAFISNGEEEYLKKSIQVPVLKENINAGELISTKQIIYRRSSQSGLNIEEIQSQQRTRHILNKTKLPHSTVTAEDYSPAKIAVIVAGRMKSSRLEKKAILPIAGMASVERCLQQCTGIKGIDNIILATSYLDSDNELENYTLSGKANLWRGDPDDVVRRYLDACDEFNIDVVVRITADCPLIIPEIIEYLLDKHFEYGADYTAAKECAVGSSGEIINVSALRKVADHFKYAEYSEYMTWYFVNNPHVFKINMVDLPKEYVRPYRMTLDYPEDLTFFNEFYLKYLEYYRDGVKHVGEIFEILDNNPGITSINSHLTLKYKTDQNLIDRLNKNTRFITKDSTF